MRIKRIMQTGIEDDLAKIEFLHDNSSLDTIFMDGDVVAELMGGLFDISWRLHRAGLQKRGPVYELDGAVSITTAQGQQGLVLRTKQGFDIAVTVTPVVLQVLKSCIQQIESDLKNDQVH